MEQQQQKKILIFLSYSFDASNFLTLVFQIHSSKERKCALPNWKKH